MTTAIKGKNLVTVVSVIAWGLALFFTAKLASAETNMAPHGTTASWYETEDALPVMHHHNSEKMIKPSQNASMITDDVLVKSWYGTEDALPYTGMQKSRAMAQKTPSQRQANTIEDLNQYSWIDTEDALPKS
jgi:hypothetical protein